MTILVRRPTRQQLLFLLALGFVILVPTAALAADAPAAPKLVAAQTTVRMDVSKDGFFDTHETPGVANGVILLSNQGTAPAEAIEVTGYFSGGRSVEVAAQAEGSDAFALEANESLLIRLSFNWEPSDSDTGWLVIKDGDRSGPALTLPFQVRELIPGQIFRLVGTWSAVAALLIALYAWLSLRIWRPGDPKIDPPGWSTDVYPGPTWTFKDSWASSVTTAGAVLGTVLAASGFLTDVLPGLSTGLFVGVSLGYGLLALLAPVIYTALHKQSKPIFGAVLVAGAITIWAVVGELVTIAQLIGRGGIPFEYGFVGAIVGLLFLARYARTSIALVVVPPPKTPPLRITILEEKVAKEALAAADASAALPTSRPAPIL
jgi:hypothetical protein